MTGKVLYRCHACGWRGWGVEADPVFTATEREAAERTLIPDPPNLAGTALARPDPRPRELNLAALDELVTRSKRDDTSGSEPSSN